MTENKTPKQFNVKVFGCGGIGSYLGEGLAKALEFQAPLSALTVLDGDVFEPKNMARQNMNTMGAKATALAVDWSPKYQNIFILPKAAWIVSEEEAAKHVEDPDDNNTIQRVTAASVMAENDWIFCTVDNFAARKLVFDAAKDFKNIDVFTGGNGSVETGDPLFGTVYHYQRRDGQDITLPPETFHDEFLNPGDRNPGEMSCAERAAQPGGTQLLAINMHVASLLIAKFAMNALGSEEEKKEAMKRAEIYSDMSVGKAVPYDRRPTLEPAVAAV